MKRRKKYDVMEVETLDDVCECIWNNTDYMLKQNKKLNKKVNGLAIIFSLALYGGFTVLAEEIQNLKIKCK